MSVRNTTLMNLNQIKLNHTVLIHIMMRYSGYDIIQYYTCIQYSVLLYTLSRKTPLIITRSNNLIHTFLSKTLLYVMKMNTCISYSLYLFHTCFYVFFYSNMENQFKDGLGTTLVLIKKQILEPTFPNQSLEQKRSLIFTLVTKNF